MIVGVIGGIGAGKSTVARMLADLGADLVEADLLAHAALEDRAVQESLRRLFGSDVVTKDGKVDRKAIAARVFSSPQEMKELEAIIHPRVVREIDAKLRPDARRPHAEILVLDVPLLLSSPLRERCTEVIFVDATLEARRRRVAERGWEPGELERREELQMRLDEKKRQADRVIDNSGSLEETRRQVKDLWREWLEARDGSCPGDRRPREESGGKRRVGSSER
jgi:dephospho-CoA kinase